MEHYDVAVVGGGIIGLATARAVLTARPDLRLVVLEREAEVATHQSGRNSNVLHSGIYYRPGSLKATMAARGRSSMVAFCAEHGIPHEVCGKVVVATRDVDLPRLDELERRAVANGVAVERIGPERLRDLEPHVTGIAALHVPETGITDFGVVSRTLAGLVEAAGGAVRTGVRVEQLLGSSTVVVQTDADPVTASVVVNCAGLWSDVLARTTDVRIVPFRGEYLDLAPAKHSLVRNLVYPVPDPAFPFLGAHLTRSIHGGVHAGPNAVLALARDGYSWGRIDPREARALVAFPGMRAIARRYWRTGAAEVFRSWSRTLMARELSRLVPGITAGDLTPSPAGVRAQAVAADGALLDDFVIRQAPGRIHLVNAPSPGATASLEIGGHMAGLVLAQLDR